MIPKNIQSLEPICALIILSLFACDLGAQDQGKSKSTNSHLDAWTSFRGNPQLTGISHASLPENPKLLWTFEVKDGIESTAAILETTVYFTSLDSNLYALDVDSGELKWKYRASDQSKASPSLHKGVIYFGDESGAFHAIDGATGKRKWIYQTDAGVISSANFDGNRVLFGSYDNHLYCLNATDGKLIWKFETEGYVHAMPAISDGNVVISGCDGYLRIIRIQDGVEIRKIPAGAYVAASPALKAERAYFGTFGNKVVCIDLVKGAKIWEYDHPQRDFPFYSSAAVTGDAVIIGGRDKLVYAFDPQTGATIWTTNLKSKVDSSPVVEDALAFIATTSGEVCALNLSSGKVVWQYDTGGSFTASPAIAQGKLIIGSNDGVLYCFGE